MPGLPTLLSIIFLTPFGAERIFIPPPQPENVCQPLRARALGNTHSKISENPVSTLVEPLDRENSHIDRGICGRIFFSNRSDPPAHDSEHECT
jgi:hypothetical protein